MHRVLGGTDRRTRRGHGRQARRPGRANLTDASLANAVLADTDLAGANLLGLAGTAVDGLARTLGNGRGVLVPPDDPHALVDALGRVLGGQRPDPAEAGPSDLCRPEAAGGC